jgi:uncharacterized iron-regulated membrane protein
MQSTITREAVFSLREVVAALKAAYPNHAVVAALPQPDDAKALEALRVGATKSALTLTWKVA